MSESSLIDIKGLEAAKRVWPWNIGYTVLIDVITAYEKERQHEGNKQTEFVSIAEEDANKPSEISVIEKALANAAEILANFTAGEAHEDGTLPRKLEEWQACYAKLFTQMAEMVATKREIGDVDRLMNRLSLIAKICIASPESHPGGITQKLARIQIIAETAKDALSNSIEGDR